MPVQLLVLAAGKGSRYGGLKQWEALGPSGEILLEYALYDSIRAGFERIVFIICREYEAALHSRLYSRLPKSLSTDIVYQDLDGLPEGSVRTKPWGTAHAVLSARDAITEPFAVVNADDYYGPSSFDLMFEFLTQKTARDRPYFSIVGFPIGRILSKWGTVSRAVCEINSKGELEGLTEYRHIERDGSGIVFKDETGCLRSIAETATASLNFFGLTPLYFTLLEKQFAQFLKEHVQSSEAEFMLPGSIDELLTQQRASVAVLHTDASWVGITYAQDVDSVRAYIADCIAQGHYPARLWA